MEKTAEIKVCMSCKRLNASNKERRKGKRKVLILFLSLTSYQRPEQTWQNDRTSNAFLNRFPHPLLLRFIRQASDLWFMPIEMMAIRVQKRYQVLEGKKKIIKK